MSTEISLVKASKQASKKEEKGKKEKETSQPYAFQQKNKSRKCSSISLVYSEHTEEIEISDFTFHLNGNKWN